MSLLKEFEENVKVVTETLEYWQEIIDQQFISEEISTKKRKGIPTKTTLSKGLKENPTRNVSVTIFLSSLLWKESYNEIRMWLNRYMPRFKNQIEQSYANIAEQLNTFSTTDPALAEYMLMDLRGKVGKLISELRYCAKMARAEFEPQKAKTKRRIAGERDDHIEEAYKALDIGGERSTIQAKHLAQKVNNTHGDKYWKMKPDNVMKSKPWNNCHPKKK